MCGISGIYHFDGGRDGAGAKRVDEAALTAMRDTLAHRGPDSAANYIEPGARAGISQRRLAIIDLSEAAACPMANADGSVWITFNGEIYNFKELRADLAAKGYKFRTQGDTEAILYGYEEYGPDFVKRLNGMFAFIIWDAKRKRLFAARDHVGVKPLYYAVQNGTLYLGSEIKAILAHPDFRKELDEPMVGHYLAFSSMPAPHTLFKDVRKLPAAHYLVAEADGTLSAHEYWNPLRPQTALPARGASEEEWIAKVRELLDDSIRTQMISDVPFGCFLSGGIDSSLNAALMSKALGTPVETFTIGTRADDAHGAKYNEFEYARRVAELLGAKRHERLVGYDDFVTFLDRYGEFADDPNGDQTCFLVFYLSELVRKSGVTVVQTGEGGDELFGGYETYRKAARLHGLWRAAARLPAPLRKAIAAAAALAKPSDFAHEYARRFAAGEQPFWGHATAFTPLQKRKLLSPKHRDDSRFYGEYAVIEEHYATVDRHAPTTDTLNRIGYLELKMRLADFLLMRVDKMGMAHSIEARVPFLDYRLVEAALHMPQSLKLKNGELKYVLKKVAEETLPRDIVHRKKQGFGAPIEEWFRDPKKAAPLLKRIYDSKLAARGLFDYGYVRELAERHARGENHAFRLMNMLTLSLWYDRWFG